MSNEAKKDMLQLINCLLPEENLMDNSWYKLEKFIGVSNIR